jgi:hypothetical protein
MEYFFDGIDLLINKDVNEQKLLNAFCSIFDIKESNIRISCHNDDIGILDDSIHVWAEILKYEKDHEYKNKIRIYLRDKTLEVNTASEAVKKIGQLCELMDCKIIIDDILTKPYEYGWLLIEGPDKYEKTAFDIEEYDNDDE